MEIYEIAYNLRIPLYVLLNEMPYDELRGWNLFFLQRPIGWREDNRTALNMMAFAGDAIKPENIFPSLATMKKQHEDRSTKRVGLAGSKMLQMMLQAKGGERLELT
jgi:hypothetical protein